MNAQESKRLGGVPTLTVKNKLRCVFKTCLAYAIDKSYRGAQHPSIDIRYQCRQSSKIQYM